MKKYLKYILLVLTFIGILYVTIPVKVKREFQIPQQYQFTNYTKWSELDTLAYLALNNVFGLDSIKLIFTYKTYSKYDAAIIHYPKQDLYYCYLNKDLSRANLYDLLYHELIHVKQYNNKELQITPDSIVYLSKTYSNIPYDDRPWEIEAYKYQDILKYQVNKLYYEKKNRFSRRK